MDQLLAMRSFVKVVDCNGFSEAARQLGIAVSSVTRQVNALEAELHTQLLNRSTRRVTLTPQGELYYRRVVPILQDVEAATLAVTEKGNVPRGLLRVSLPVAFGRLNIAPLLGEFMAEYPEIQLDLTFSDGLANLVEDGLDLVIRMGNLDRSGAGWIVRKLASYSRKVCGSPAYFQQHSKPQHPNDLAGHNCLCFNYSIGANVWRFQRDQEICEVRVSGSLSANHSEVLRQACLDSAGLILMPTWLIGADLEAHRLETALEDFLFHPQLDLDTGIYALYLPNRRHSLRVQVFVDFLMERFGG